MDLLEQLVQGVMEGAWQETPALTKKALEDGTSPHAILDKITSAMDTVGREWREGNMFIPEVLVSAKAMQASMEVIRPLLTVTDQRERGTVVIGTVQGDLHDIGKSLVGMMLQGAGFKVIDLGVDTSPEKFVNAIREYHPDIVGFSTLLTTTLSFMRDSIRTLEEAGLRGKVKVIVGGAPVTEAYAKSIGADSYAPDAASAVDKVRELLGLTG
jgi:5-methyltetrahydrofolate--homocysteine methyltransferase